MTDAATLSAYGELIDPGSVRLERRLPGPIERVWSYLVDSELRGQWLAVGDMTLQPGAPVEFVWRNDELGVSDEGRPEGMPEERRMVCEVIRAEPPRLLMFTWGESGSEVTFELEPQGADVKLTLTHRRIAERSTRLGVSAGWHAHLEMLVARLNDRALPPFWTMWNQLRAQYDRRLP